MKKNRIAISILLPIIIILGFYGWRQYGTKKIILNAGGEEQLAAETLIKFFGSAASGDFKQASTLLYPINANGQYDWGLITQYRDPEKTNITKDDELAYYCHAVGTCLNTNILSTVKKSDGDYIFTVQFHNADGSLFNYGPFGGVDRGTEPTQTQFQYEVKKINGIFKVTTPPLYTP